MESLAGVEYNVYIENYRLQERLNNNSAGQSASGFTISSVDVRNFCQIGLAPATC